MKVMMEMGWHKKRRKGGYEMIEVCGKGDSSMKGKEICVKMGRWSGRRGKRKGRLDRMAQ
jgi:hypothetical protein